MSDDNRPNILTPNVHPSTVPPWGRPQSQPTVPAPARPQPKK